jgi:IS30 family transposase
MVARTTFVEKVKIKTLASEGCTYRQIAARTNKSLATVSRIVKKPLEKKVLVFFPFAFMGY